MSHFVAIGLGFDGPEAQAAGLDRMMDAAVADVAGPGDVQHLLWRDASGAAVAFHVEGQAVACATPFFAPLSGLARWTVRTSAPADDPECVHCGGADCDVLDGAGEVVTRTTVQWLHSAPYRGWLGQERTFELETAALAESAGFYADSAAFKAAQADWWGAAKTPSGEPLRFAEQSFLPEGMFAPPGAPVGQRAAVMLTGQVQSALSLRNTLTRAPFWQVRVATVPGALDVVVAPGSVKGEPKPGQLAIVRAWLVGRPVEPPPGPAQRSWLRRVLERS